MPFKSKAQSRLMHAAAHGDVADVPVSVGKKFVAEGHGKSQKGLPERKGSDDGPSDDSGYGIHGKDSDSDDRGSERPNFARAPKYRGGKQYNLKKEGRFKPRK